MIPDKIKVQLSSIPSEPGIYIMKDAAGAVIYIGKALSLKKRVTSYFTKKDHDVKTAVLVRLIDSFEYIATANEVEALILENTLIKKHKPKFNIRLKDDKRYPYIGITYDEDYPRVIYTRNLRPGPNRYFGPYTDARSAKMIWSVINDAFRLKRCRRPLPLRNGERPCLNYQIKKCAGPCAGAITRDEYMGLIEGAANFLSGRIGPVLEEMTARMNKCSADMDYEKASVYRDIIFSIQSISETQNVLNPSGLDQDFIKVKLFENEAILVLFEFRGGALLGRKISVYENIMLATPAEITSAFIMDYYQRSDVPSRVVCSDPPASAAAVELFLAGRSGKNVKLTAPSPSENERAIISLIEKNIDLLKADRIAEAGYLDPAAAMNNLKEELSLDGIPERIECFDISNFHGSEAVASMVTFSMAMPEKSSYRRYRIRSIEGPNDPAMIHEAVARRVQYLVNEGEPLPDLMLIDGGPTQLARAMEAASNFEAGIKIVSIAKRFEEIYYDPGLPPLRLGTNSPGLKLLQRIRDEAHRFAVTYHRVLRDRKTTASELDAIPGIGEKTKRDLLKVMKSVEKIKAATIEELSSIEGIGAKSAERIFRFFNGK
jgi:excinuclease ABC subunit C